MHRYRFILLRPFQLIPVLFGISIVTFVLVRLIPGDPARVLLGARATPSASAVAVMTLSGTVAVVRTLGRPSGHST